MRSCGRPRTGRAGPFAAAPRRRGGGLLPVADGGGLKWGPYTSPMGRRRGAALISLGGGRGGGGGAGGAAGRRGRRLRLRLAQGTRHQWPRGGEPTSTAPAAVLCRSWGRAVARRAVRGVWDGDRGARYGRQARVRRARGREVPRAAGRPVRD